MSDKVATKLVRWPALRFRALDKSGREKVDPVPVAPPVGYKKQPSMVELVRDMIKSEKLRQEAESAGMESFEDADDFDVEDDYDPTTPYEEEYDPIDRDAERRLTRYEHEAKVRERLQFLQSRTGVGVEDGDPEFDKGRMGDSDGGSGRRDKKRKGKSEPQQNADDE